MARRLNILNGELPVANNGLRLSETILIEKIEEHPKFKNLFTMDRQLLERITEDIRTNQFDASQPVHIWVTQEEGTERRYLIDGYTRVEAARAAGKMSVPYFKHTFETFEEAYRYALSLQTNRRNLEGADLINNIRELMGSEYVRTLAGNKNAAVAALLGKSEKTVERANFVSNNASDEQLADIEAGRRSVNRTFTDIKRRDFVEKNGSDEQKERLESGGATVDEIYAELKEGGQAMETDGHRHSRGDFDIFDGGEDDRSGIPAPLNFRYSDGITRPDGRLKPEQDRERTRERRRSYELGFEDGARSVFMKVTDMLGRGTAAEELSKDGLFSDFSYKVLAPRLGLGEVPE